MCPPLADFAPIDDTFAVSHFVDKSSDLHQFCGSDPNCLADRHGDYNRGTTEDIERWLQLKVSEIWVWDYVSLFVSVPQ